MLWYAPAVLMAAFFMVISNYFVAMGNQKMPALAYSLGCITSLLLAPYLVETYAIKGAALNAFFTFLIICVSMTFLFLQQNKGNVKRLVSISNDIQNIKNWISSIS